MGWLTVLVDIFLPSESGLSIGCVRLLARFSGSGIQLLIELMLFLNTRKTLALESYNTVTRVYQLFEFRMVGLTVKKTYKLRRKESKKNSVAMDNQ
jgi:hypothetical protein